MPSQRHTIAPPLGTEGCFTPLASRPPRTPLSRASQGSFTKPTATSIPEKLLALQLTWSKHNPDWVHLVWTDEDIEEWIRTNFAWFFGTFARYETPVQRADAFRYFALSAYGGVYADMDYECKVSLDRVAATMTRPIGFVSPGEDSHSISNSLIISEHVPEYCSDILYELVRTACTATKGLSAWFPRARVLQSTGPGMLRAWLQRAQPSYVCSLERRLFSPCHFCEETCDATSSYAVHHYGKSWNRWDSAITNWWNCSPASRQLLLCASIALIVCGSLLTRLRRRACLWSPRG